MANIHRLASSFENTVLGFSCRTPVVSSQSSLSRCSSGSSQASLSQRPSQRILLNQGSVEDVLQHAGAKQQQLQDVQKRRSYTEERGKESTDVERKSVIAAQSVMENAQLLAQAALQRRSSLRSLDGSAGSDSGNENVSHDRPLTRNGSKKKPILPLSPTTKMLAGVQSDEALFPQNKDPVFHANTSKPPPVPKLGQREVVDHLPPSAAKGHSPQLKEQMARRASSPRPDCLPPASPGPPPPPLRKDSIGKRSTSPRPDHLPPPPPSINGGQSPALTKARLSPQLSKKVGKYSVSPSVAIRKSASQENTVVSTAPYYVGQVRAQGVAVFPPQVPEPSQVPEQQQQRWQQQQQQKMQIELQLQQQQQLRQKPPVTSINRKSQGSPQPMQQMTPPAFPPPAQAQTKKKKPPPPKRSENTRLSVDLTQHQNLPRNESVSPSQAKLPQGFFKDLERVMILKKDRSSQGIFTVPDGKGQPPEFEHVFHRHSLSQQQLAPVDDLPPPPPELLEDYHPPFLEPVPLQHIPPPVMRKPAEGTLQQTTSTSNTTVEATGTPVLRHPAGGATCTSVSRHSQKSADASSVMKPVEIHKKVPSPRNEVEVSNVVPPVVSAKPRVLSTAELPLTSQEQCSKAPSSPQNLTPPSTPKPRPPVAKKPAVAHRISADVSVDDTKPKPTVAGKPLPPPVSEKPKVRPKPPAKPPVKVKPQ